MFHILPCPSLSLSWHRFFQVSRSSAPLGVTSCACGTDTSGPPQTWRSWACIKCILHSFQTHSELGQFNADKKQKTNPNHPPGNFYCVSAATNSNHLLLIFCETRMGAAHLVPCPQHRHTAWGVQCFITSRGINTLQEIVKQVHKIKVFTSAFCSNTLMLTILLNFILIVEKTSLLLLKAAFDSILDYKKCKHILWYFKMHSWIVQPWGENVS